MEPPESVSELERLAEAYYDAMYDSRYPTGEYANAKDAFAMRSRSPASSAIPKPSSGSKPGSLTSRQSSARSLRERGAHFVEEVRLRTALRHQTRYVLGPDTLCVDGPAGTLVEWARLDRLKLSYFSTKRDRTGGWMQLSIGSTGGRQVKVDSSERAKEG